MKWNILMNPRNQFVINTFVEVATEVQKPLFLAIRNGHSNIVQLLLDHGADPNRPNPITGERPLPLTAEKGQTDFVQALLKAHASIELPNVNTGDTALISAAREGHREVVQILIDAKVQLNAWNKKKNSALDEAISNKKLSTVALLLSHRSFIQFPGLLINFLILEIRDERDPDHRNPDLLVVLPVLASLKNEYNNPHNYLNSFIKKQLEEVDSYLTKLKTLTAIHQKETFNAVYEATNSIIPTTVLKIITEYDDPLQRLKFFKPAEIDELLPKKEEEKKQDSREV